MIPKYCSICIAIFQPCVILRDLAHMPLNSLSYSIVFHFHFVIIQRPQFIFGRLILVVFRRLLIAEIQIRVHIDVVFASFDCIWMSLRSFQCLKVFLDTIWCQSTYKPIFPSLSLYHDFFFISIQHTERSIGDVLLHFERFFCKKKYSKRLNKQCIQIYVIDHHSGNDVGLNQPLWPNDTWSDRQS